MANNIHFEARRRQMFLDRVARQKEQEMAPCKGESVAVSSPGDQQNAEPIMCTDQGQFYQTRADQIDEMRRHLAHTDVVFEKVVHDPNFYYRASKDLGLEPPQHVNEIYEIMYPGTTMKTIRNVKN